MPVRTPYSNTIKPRRVTEMIIRKLDRAINEIDYKVKRLELPYISSHHKNNTLQRSHMVQNHDSSF